MTKGVPIYIFKKNKMGKNVLQKWGGGSVFFFLQNGSFITNTHGTDCLVCSKMA